MKFTYTRELELNLKQQDFQEGLAYNVTKAKFGSFFTDLFTSTGAKYKGTVRLESFTLTFIKSLSNPRLFYPVIMGKYHEIDNSLKVNIKVTSINWLARILLIQLVAVILFARYLFLGIANDLTDIFVISLLLLAVMLPITAIELHRMSKVARTTIEEIEKDIQRIETAYNSRYT
ncbi:MAG: hypothetical protein AAFN93_04095 [Bacteroidota bacterium]